LVCSIQIEVVARKIPIQLYFPAAPLAVAADCLSSLVVHPLLKHSPQNNGVVAVAAAAAEPLFLKGDRKQTRYGFLLLLMQTLQMDD
jgi:hypothetical protein